MTMKDVAELAGVSTAAVSRYLNGGYISEDKAARIKEAIEQTGYVRSNQARALRTGRTGLVGVIVPKINSESVSRVVAGIGQCLQEHDYQMLLADAANDPAREVTYLDIFRKQPVDAIILEATTITPEYRMFFDESKIPLVIVGQKVEGNACVYHDDFAAARDLARAIARSNPGRIAYVGVTREDASAGAAREDGFRAGLEEAGVSLPADAVGESPFTVEGGRAAAKRLLEAHPDIDFFACATDVIAAGAVSALADHGVVDAARHVSGFGDNQLMRAISGGIPTVHYPYFTSGFRAAEMVLAALDGRPLEPHAEALAYSLVGI